MDVCIGAREHEHVVIRVQSAANPSGDGWLICNLDVAAGAWSGSFEAWLCSWDFSRLREQLETLHENLSGTARFETLEGQLELEFTIDNRGHIEIACIAVDRAGDGNRLHFCLEIDQSHLPQIICDLRAIEQAFPHNGPVA